MMQEKGRLAPDEGRYPSADEMPELKADEAKGVMNEQVSPEMNPIMDALSVLQEYVLAAEGKGDPAAAAMKEHLVQFVQSMAGQGAPASEGTEEMPEEEVEMPEEGEQEVMEPKKKLNKRIGNAVPMI